MLGTYTHAEGTGTVAGIKGYYYSKINFSGGSPVITLTTEQGVEPSAPFSISYAVGDVISLVHGTKYYNCSTITAVSDNTITVDQLPFEESGVITYGKDDFDDYSLYVLSKPSEGVVALGLGAHAEGDRSSAFEWASHAEGRQTTAYGQYAHAEGRATKAAYASHAEGYSTEASGFYAHSEGQHTKAVGSTSHAEGHASVSEGNCSHAEGVSTTASGEKSHSEGYGTKAIGENSHAQGSHTYASGLNAHAEGNGTSAKGRNSHAQGNGTTAIGENSHAQGLGSVARGPSSHAGGNNSEAYGYVSFAHGVSLRAGHNQAVFGVQNEDDPDASFIIGNGSNDVGKNIFTIKKDGRAVLGASPQNDMDAVTKQYADRENQSVRSVANGALSIAKDAASSASNAQSAADSASNVAGEAKTEAEAATNSANVANEVAKDALAAANEAVSAASNAQSSAYFAMQKADEALEAAQDAKAEAESRAGCCVITINFDSAFAGKTFTVTDGAGDNHTGTVPDSLISTVSVKNCNTEYTITSVSDDGISCAVTMTTGPYFGQHTATLGYAKIFGVCWGKSSSTALSRLTKANDPNGHVNVDIGSEPAPAVGTGTGSSPFDNYAPWKDMVEYNVIDGAVSYKKGDSGFSRTSYDTMVKIPEFYYKVVESDGIRCFYVADKATEGFAKHPGSGRYVGRYNTITGYYSKSGSAPLGDITRYAARTGSKRKGTGWYLYDYASWCAIWLLYLVEFADWDSQTVIGKGVVNALSIVSCGGTDSMTYHTGRAAGTDGQTPVQYRWIENPWGNISEWIDGVTFTESEAYICTNPDNYDDDISTNYTAAGVTFPSSDGFITDLVMTTAFDWSFFPSAVGGSSTTYIPDYVGSNKNGSVLHVGGNWNTTSSAGLFCFIESLLSSSAHEGIGARLLFVL